ncbi:MAG: amidohydrolase family protein, partial [Ignavibacteriales bacterium]|nr:amidohydrolase family protein [Ignavibacteriales bacterium]
MKILIQHGSVCLDDRIEVADILVADEKIAAIADSISTLNADRTVDASGKYVLPGLIDIHTHLDDKIGSCSLADTYRTGTEIAVRNGMTTICSFITQMQGETLGASIARAQQKADSNCYCNIGWHLTPTAFGENDWREIERSVEAGFHTFKFYTTYRNAGIYCGYERLEAIVQRLSSRGIQFLVHCEDDEVLAAQVRLMELAENLGEPITHAQMRPSGAETKAINRVMEIAVRYQAK